MAQQVHCIIFWTGCKIFILSPYNHSSRRKSIKSICWGMLKGVHFFFFFFLKSQRPHFERAQCYNSTEHLSSPHPSIFNPRPFIDPPECRPISSRSDPSQYDTDISIRGNRWVRLSEYVLKWSIQACSI